MRKFEIGDRVSVGKAGEIATVEGFDNPDDPYEYEVQYDTGQFGWVRERDMERAY